jgi:hypothetical protein
MCVIKRQKINLPKFKENLGGEARIIAWEKSLIAVTI